MIARLAFALPMRLRWKLFREFGGRDKKWVQWIYDSDGDYSLKSMRSKNCIFIHIPKCAGRSISLASLGDRGAAHASVEDFLSVFGSAWFDQAFKFAFVRDPWSRLVSAYDFLRNGGLHEDDRKFADENIVQYRTVDDFVMTGLEQPKIRKWAHFRDQVDFLMDPRTGSLGVDFIGRFETITEDFAVVCRRLGIDATLGRHNARNSVAGDPSLVLSSTAVDEISRIYERDVRLLGYAGFRPGAEASSAP